MACYYRSYDIAMSCNTVAGRKQMVYVRIVCVLQYLALIRREIGQPQPSIYIVSVIAQPPLLKKVVLRYDRNDDTQ